MNFSKKSTSFWVAILSSIFALAAVAGIEWPTDPATLANGVVNTVTGPTGYVGLIGLLVTNIVGPVWKYIRSPKAFSIEQFFGTPNTWISIGTALVAIVLLFGIAIPAGTVETIVGAVYTRDYTTLISVLIANVLNPVVRWIRDRRTTVPAV